MKPQQHILELLKRELQGVDESKLTDTSIKIAQLFAKRKKPITIPFEESDIFGEENFKKAFPDWSAEKVAHYHAAAESYSAEGKEYADWKKAMKNWESTGRARGLKFEEKSNVYTPNIYNPKK